MTYESVSLQVSEPSEKREDLYTFESGNPVLDYLACGRKCRELKLDYVMLSSDVDHFVMDGDLYEWKLWPDGSERFIFNENYTWAYTSYSKTGWISDTYGTEYIVRFMRICSPKERKQNDTLYEKTIITFYSKNPVQAIRWMAQQLQEGYACEPKEFHGSVLTKGNDGYFTRFKPT